MQASNHPATTISYCNEALPRLPLRQRVRTWLDLYAAHKTSDTEPIRGVALPASIHTDHQGNQLCAHVLTSRGTDLVLVYRAGGRAPSIGCRPPEHAGELDLFYSTP